MLWGKSDRVVTPTYGRQFADAIPDARFHLVPEAGHFPQVERLADVVSAVRSFST